MRPHIDAQGRFQSDKYPTTPPGLVPLKTSDELAQDLLLIYAQRRREIATEFSDDLITCLAMDGFRPAIAERQKNATIAERQKNATEGGV